MDRRNNIVKWSWTGSSNNCPDVLVQPPAIMKTEPKKIPGGINRRLCSAHGTKKPLH